MRLNQRENRLGEENVNHQGCLMKIVEYNTNRDMIVEFQDKYGAKVHTSYSLFLNGGVKNPYIPSVLGIGMIGSKYPSKINKKAVKEYRSWQNMLGRCINGYKTYHNVTCCKEWLLYENFYEWLHSQDNFDKWLEGNKWGVDKDILIKGNKIYSSETCCLVPHNVNALFVKSNSIRGNLPIGVRECKYGFEAVCTNPITHRTEHLGIFATIEDAFLAYKNAKEKYIKQVAKIEYAKGNITKCCYDAMMNYEVEITD